MKRYIALLALMLPLIGCGGITDIFTPIIGGLPDEALVYAEKTNAPPKLFGWFHTKAQLEDLIQQCTDQHEENQLLFEQAYDREGLAFKHVSGETATALDRANEFQAQVMNPVIDKGTVALSMALGGMAGGTLLKRKGDITKEDAEKDKLAALKAAEVEATAKIKEAGLKDPEKFKESLV